MTTHITWYSGGAASWATARRVQSTRAQPGEDHLLVFADTKMEDEDLYRFLKESADSVNGAELVWLQEGRDPWEVFYDVRYLGNTRRDPCSANLKRNFLRDWLESNFQPDEVVCYLGYDFSEAHRLDKARSYWDPYRCEAPLLSPPHMDKDHILSALRAEGIEIPRLYKMGFPHNNCGGFCVRAGISQFVHLLEQMPERYRKHERKEQQFREWIDKDVSILRDRTLAARREAIGVGPDDDSRDDEIPSMVPLTLRELRLRMEDDPERYSNLDEWGGCGCFAPTVSLDLIEQEMDPNRAS